MLDKVMLEFYMHDGLNTMNYILRIPLKRLAELELSQSDKDLMNKASTNPEDLVTAMKTLLMIVENIEKQKDKSNEQ